MLGWLKGKNPAAATPAPPPAAPTASHKPAELSQDQRALLARIEARFPSSDLFRIPPEMVQINDRKDFKDDPLDARWSSLLKAWPEPPITDADRAKREAQFWNLYADMFTIREEGNSSAPQLEARAETQGYFTRNELWVLRFYYAATGKIIRTMYYDICQARLKGADLLADMKRLEKQIEINNRQREESFSAYQKKITTKPAFFDHGVFTGPRDALMSDWERARSKYDNNNTQIESLYDHTIPAHLEKWGDWFWTGIENAFRQKHDKPAPASNVFGRGGFATLDDINRTQARQGEPDRRAQSQTFKD